MNSNIYSGEPVLDDSDIQKLFSVSSKELFKRIERQKRAHLLQLLELLQGIHPEYGEPAKAPGAPSATQISAYTFAAFLRSHQRQLSLQSRIARSWAAICRQLFELPIKKAVYSGRMVLAAALLYEFKAIEDRAGTAKEEWLHQCRSLVKLLRDELLNRDKVDLATLLTPEGTERWMALLGETQTGSSATAGHGSTAAMADASLYRLANLTDLPAQEDYLSRKALAAYLAKRLQYIYHKELATRKQGSFFTHIDGAWGSGKSTLLHFLKKELKGGYQEGDVATDWIVVDFNAWQHQRLNPPWWFLMNAVYQQTSRHLWDRKRYGQWFEWFCGEWWWRLNTGTNYLLASLATFLLFFASVYFGFYNNAEWKALPAVQVASFIGFLWSFTKLLRTSLVPGSAKAALNFIEEHGKDPMQVLAKHFNRQVCSLKRPVAIFIDDLDRCYQDYGIQLLEGLQTVFKDAPVVYVIAADRKWLTTMYEAQFPNFADIIAKPGKPFGLVFLDKVFQLSVELPPISSLLKESYWKFLLQGNNLEEVNRKKAAAVDAITQADSNEDKMRLAEQETDGQQKQWLKEASVSQFSIGQETREVEHHLQQFIDLVEPNPRAMKRLVNDISTAKTITYLYNDRVNQDQLILWTILRIQYPLLADFFWYHPEKVGKVNQPGADIKTGSAVLDGLLKEPEVRQLFMYKKNGKVFQIDEEFIYQLKFERKPDALA